MTTASLADLLDPAKITGEADGIYLTSVEVASELQVSQAAWETIFDFDLAEMERDRADYRESKLDDHVAVLRRYRDFSQDDVYLEIGCGPAYIAEHLMRTADVAFVGIDFNLKILQTLRQYLDKQGLTKYLLIHADINTMPLRDGSVDFIYGGGVIEHFADTGRILRESFRVLKPGGTSFNSVPALNLSWLPLRFFNNIPVAPVLRPALTWLHLRLLKGRVLERNYGYELSFTRRTLAGLHRRAGFSSYVVAPLAFHPSSDRLRSPWLRALYYRVAGLPLVAPVYYVAATIPGTPTTPPDRAT